MDSRRAFHRRGFHRRAFLRRSAVLSALVGAEIVFCRYLPTSLYPVALASSDGIAGKDGLTILNDRPLNAETPAHLLNDDITPTSRLFVRNNGVPPGSVDIDTWILDIDGESAISPTTFTISQLKQQFEPISLQLTLECGGNGRSEYDPPEKGNQWSIGAVGCPTWQGILLKVVLERVGYKNDAVYLAYDPTDEHLSRQPGKLPISRGVPVAKALQDESMIVFGMNEKPLPAI